MSDDSTPEAPKTGKTATAKETTAARKTTTAKATKKTPTKTTTARKAPAKKAAPKKTTAAKPKTAAKKVTSAATKASTKKSAPKTDGKKQTKTEAINENTTQEETPKTDNSSNENFIEDMKHKNWGASLQRGVFMLIFGFVGQFALSVTFFLAFLQFIVSLVVGPPNATLTSAIVTASRYLSEILAYLSFKTDELPFPFGRDFPSEK